jgi:integrase
LVADASGHGTARTAMNSGKIQTIADALRAYDSVAGSNAKEATRDVICLCRWMKRDPEMTPADRDALIPMLRAIKPGEIGIGLKRLQNTRASMWRVINAVTKSIKAHKSPLGDPWQSLLDLVPGPWQRKTVKPFFRFAQTVVDAPQLIDEAVLAAYEDHRRHVSFAKEPKKHVRCVRRAWEKARATVEGWPTTSLASPPRRYYGVPRGSFRPEFKDDITRYCAARRRNLNGAAPSDGKVYRYRLRDRSKPLQSQKELAESTLRRHVDTIYLAASTLVHEGKLRVEDIRCISDVISVGTAELVADTVLERSGRSTEYGATLAKTFRSIAASWLQPTKEELEEYHQLIQCLEEDGRPKGMTETNWRRVCQFDDDAVFGTLVSLPETIMNELEQERRRRKRITKSMARTMLRAAGLMLELTMPVRRQVLATTDFDRHIRWPKRRHGRGFLYYGPAEDKKARKNHSAPLSPWKVKLLRLCKDDYQPVLVKDKHNRHLFPALKGPGHMALGALAEAVCRLVKVRMPGIEINLQLFRHIAATKLIDDDLRNEPAAAHLLGHSPGSRSTPRYGEIKARAAAREYERIIDQDRSTSLSLKRHAGVMPSEVAP